MYSLHIIDTIERFMPDRKDEAVLIRLSPKDKRKLDKAAVAADRRTSDYVRLAALKQADQDLNLIKGQKKLDETPE